MNDPTPNVGHALTALVTMALFAFFIGGLVVTLGWNYGVSELISKFNGHDVNINIIQGAFVALFLHSIGRAATARSK